MSTTSQAAIYHNLASVPEGKVVTYGLLAKLSGLGAAARLVGTTLKRLPADTQLPWHRVINSQGKISLSPAHPNYQLQKRLLEAEGVEFKKDKVNLHLFLWNP